MVQVGFESVELERGGTVRGFNRPSFVADFDAHIVGYLVAAGVFQKLDEGNCAQQSSYARGKGKLLGSEQMDCSRVASYDGSEWLRIASVASMATTGGGVEWWR